MSYSSDYSTLNETIEIICKTFALWIKPLFYWNPVLYRCTSDIIHDSVQIGTFSENDLS